jgi:hypothetical protein
VGGLREDAFAGEPHDPPAADALLQDVRVLLHLGEPRLAFRELLLEIRSVRADACSSPTFSVCCRAVDAVPPIPDRVDVLDVGMEPSITTHSAPGSSELREQREVRLGVSGTPRFNTAAPRTIFLPSRRFLRRAHDSARFAVLPARMRTAASYRAGRHSAHRRMRKGAAIRRGPSAWRGLRHRARTGDVTSNPRDRVFGLDLLRRASPVVFNHFSVVAGGSSTSRLQARPDWRTYGVELFFVLSGFDRQPVAGHRRADPISVRGDLHGPPLAHHPALRAGWRFLCSGPGRRLDGHALST